jgi:phospholipase/lecithinase/hemolysin
LEAIVQRKRNAEVAIAIYDAVKLFNKVLDNPKEYGFKDAISTGNSDQCVWRDLIHPTTAMHKVIAADIAKFLIGEEEKSEEKPE